MRPLFHDNDGLFAKARAVTRGACRWIGDRTVHRHHVVHTGLPPGWHDVDAVMFHACFALLGRYVEKELGRVAGHVDSVDLFTEQAVATAYRGYRLDRCGSAERTDQTAIDLWCWYRYELPSLEALLPGAPSIDLDDVKQAKLNQLMAVRRSLWT